MAPPSPNPTDDTIVFIRSMQKPRKRWQKAYKAICFLVFLTKKRIVAAKESSGFSRLLSSRSFVTIAIEDKDHKPSFDIDKNMLSEMVSKRDMDGLSRLGGVKAMAAVLEADEKGGIDGNAAGIENRIDFFGSNTYKKAPAKSFFTFVLEAFKDTTIIILLICAVLSLGFGIKEHGPEDGWYDGGSIIVAIFLVLAVSSISNFSCHAKPRSLDEEDDEGQCNGPKALSLRDNGLSHHNLIELIQEGVALNTSGEVYMSNSATLPEISGSPTESAILLWAVSDLALDFNGLKQGHEILQVEAFNSQKKRSGALVRKNHGKGVQTVQMHWKGAAEMILDMCSKYHVKSGEIKALDDEERANFQLIIRDLACKSLRCVAFAYKVAREQSEKKLEESELTLLGLVGIKDPCRPGAKEAVDAQIKNEWRKLIVSA